MKEAKHIDKTMAEVESVVPRLEAVRYKPPAVRPKTCTDCDLWHYCNR
ncbi:MAG: hypothetical protein LBS44_05695 [Deltaproteobacteria bacterium]|nr:hypothetical protein [Deltaproteobacteria bacterium]